MIKITKKLDRPDGGTVATGSIIDYNSKFVGKGKQVVFFLSHYVSLAAIDSGKEKIPAITNFTYKQIKECSDEEWTSLMTAPNAGMQTQIWLQEIIDANIGKGNTEIV